MTDIDGQLQNARVAWLEVMKDFKDPFGRIQLPLPPLLTKRHLENCRILLYREAILEEMQVGGVAAEVGVQTGRFSQTIIKICRPSRLHLIDLDLHTHAVHEKLRAEIDAGVVHLHEGDSSSTLREFPDRYFDFIYIDANHTYHGVKRDLDVAKTKVKEHGFLLFNDYTYWSPQECMRYGVIQAVNELCLEEDWEILYFALSNYMYFDVAIRRRA